MSEDGLYACQRCGGRFEGVDFRYDRTTGVVCKFCICTVLGHENVDEYDRESFYRGSRSPRGG